MFDFLHSNCMLSVLDDAIIINSYNIQFNDKRRNFHFFFFFFFFFSFS